MTFDLVSGQASAGSKAALSASGVAVANSASKLRDKIRANLVRQKALPYASTFYNKPAAWQANTVYQGGQAVLASSGWWICTGGTSGASAPTWAVTPSTSSPYQFVSDNTASWSYYGPDIPVYLTDTIVALAWSASHASGLTSNFTDFVPVSGNWGSPTGYVPDTNTNQTHQFIPTGGGTTAVIASWVGDLLRSPNSMAVVARQTSGGALGLGGGIGNRNITYELGGHYWEIETESQIIEFASSQYDYTGVRVLVDDVEYEVGAQFPSAAVLSGLNNNNLYMTLTFTGPVKKRNIKISGLDGIRAIRIQSNAALYPVTQDPQTLNVLAFGDSIFAGSAQGPSRPFATWPNLTFAELGGRMLLTNLSVGGTGLEVGDNTGSGVNYNWLQRLTESAANVSRTTLGVYNSTALQAAVNSYDLIWVDLPNNNDNPASPTLPAKILTFLQTLRTYQPNAFIWVHGGWQGTNASNADAFDAVVKAVFTQWGDPNSAYTITRQAGGAPVSWEQGSGYCASGHISSTGNTSLLVGGDGVHPDDAGIKCRAQRSAQAVMQLLGV